MRWSDWTFTMLERELLTLGEVNELLELEQLYRRCLSQTASAPMHATATAAGTTNSTGTPSSSPPLTPR